MVYIFTNKSDAFYSVIIFILVLNNINKNKSTEQIDKEADIGSPLHRIHVLPAYSRQLASKHLSTPTLDEVLNDSDKTRVQKVGSVDQTSNCLWTKI